jgi:hypothetical protein
LVFEEDLAARRDAEHRLLAALGAHGLGDTAGAIAHVGQVLAGFRSAFRAVSLARQLGLADGSPE